MAVTQQTSLQDAKQGNHLDLAADASCGKELIIPVKDAGAEHVGSAGQVSKAHHSLDLQHTSGLQACPGQCRLPVSAGTGSIRCQKLMQDLIMHMYESDLALLLPRLVSVRAAGGHNGIDPVPTCKSLWLAKRCRSLEKSSSIPDEGSRPSSELACSATAAASSAGCAWLGEVAPAVLAACRRSKYTPSKAPKASWTLLHCPVDVPVAERT